MYVCVLGGGGGGAYIFGNFFVRTKWMVPRHDEASAFNTFHKHFIIYNMNSFMQGGTKTRKLALQTIYSG